jgi:hypothetical protein
MLYNYITYLCSLHCKLSIHFVASYVKDKLITLDNCMDVKDKLTTLYNYIGLFGH